ncbi:hypothetical protein RN22_14545 [Grimontia sp. AD028]|uniref:hypothetical protein n=1 Tax=Grimontia sp. AD028 TaxID=1581149 RepID=UPI00061B002C|nr:hypothetical protein [Grimontia sp. AD028]KKD59663.1 hypothetical protein RN22_14545 [Grimontia sp. AD028]
MASYLARFKSAITSWWKPLTGLIAILLLAGCGATSASRGNTAEVDTALSNIPIYAVIKEQDPAVYNRLVDVVASLNTDKSNYGELVQATATELYAFVEPRLSHASDDSIIEYMTIQVEKMDILKALGGGQCYQFLALDPNGPVVDISAFPRDLIERDMDTLEEIIVTSTTKQPIPSMESVVPNIERVFYVLGAKYGDGIDMLDNMALASQNKEVYCDIIIDLYDEILTLPKDEAVATLRWMLAEE